MERIVPKPSGEYYLSDREIDGIVNNPSGNKEFQEQNMILPGLRFTPKVIESIFNFERARKRSNEKDKKYFGTRTEPLLIGAFTAYSIVSGRKLKDVWEQGLGLPAACFYYFIVKGDDGFDKIHKNPNIQAGEIYNATGKGNSLKPGDFYNKGMELIRGNMNLSRKSKDYICGRMNTVKRNYVECEDKVKIIAKKGKNNWTDDDFKNIVRLREIAFGGIAEAITCVLEGEGCNSDHSRIVQKELGFFNIAVSEIDGQKDRKQDLFNCDATPTLLADAMDVRKKRDFGITSNALLDAYIEKIRSNQLQNMIRFGQKAWVVF